MRVVLISPYPDITSFGVRTLSAWLRAHDIETRCLFLPDPTDENTPSEGDPYDAALMESLISHCEDADLIGISLMTNYFANAVQITNALRANMAVPIVWGGVHATVRPQECLLYADFVCVGDGEETLLALVHSMQRGESPAGIQGLWGRWQGTVFQNAVGSLPSSLDQYPAPDWSGIEHFICENNSLVPLTQARVHALLAAGSVSRLIGLVGYQTMTGRGCPHRCSYCINDAIKKLYGARNYLRWRSVDHVIDELETAITAMPFIGFIWISDDAFFGRPLKDIQQFCDAYSRRIGLPFTCLVSPLTLRKDKLSLLVDAGLVYLQMGVQTGSSNMQKLFNRARMDNDTILHAMYMINSFKEVLLPPSYDLIVDTPWETDGDKLNSLRLISKIPKPFRLQPFSLVLYPGTALHDKAIHENLIHDECHDVYMKHYTMRAMNYTNLLIALSKSGRMPQWLFKLFITSVPWRILGAPVMQPLISRLYLLLKDFKSIITMGKA